VSQPSAKASLSLNVVSTPTHRTRSPCSRARRERPRRRRAAEKRDELAPSHSITSSASNCIELGTSMPSALAVCRLITNSKFARLHHGQIGRFLAFENPPYIDAH
jgi:hypothetical protein